MELDCFRSELVHVTRLGGEDFGALEFDVTIHLRHVQLKPKRMVCVSESVWECVSE